jgi:hypothetical protein
MPREGWLDRQRANSAREVKTWPDWLRRETGLEDKTKEKAPPPPKKKESSK